MSNLLEVKNLSVEYKMKEGYLSAVNNVSFNIQEGEVFALVGESGCGKSTTAFAINNLFFSGNEKLGGSVMFQGKDLLKLSNKEMTKIRGKEIGMIFQNPLDSLNPVYRVGNQIEEALLIDKISKKEAYDITLSTFKKVQIPDSEERMQSYPHELSGGMRQRVMISMMLARNPKLLIADEPTTALDVSIQAQILDLLKELQKEYNTAILIITHNFNTVQKIANKVGVMYGGNLVETGTVEQVFKNPKHPYTIKLMRALPTKRKNDGPLEVIEGSVPRFTSEEIGCRFVNRCHCSIDECKTRTPEMIEVEDGHFCACIKYLG